MKELLYLFPLILIPTAAGAYHLSRSLVKRNLQLIALTSLLLLSLVVIYKRGFPFQREEIKKSLSYLSERIADTDKLYIYYPTTRSFLFYRQDFPGFSKLDDEDIITGTAHRDNWPAYQQEIQDINHPVWILFSHVYKPKGPEVTINEEECIKRAFENNGFEIVDKKVFKGSSVYKAIPQQK